MKQQEMVQIVNLLYNEWDLGKEPAQAKGKICAWIYLMEILEESEYIILEKRDKKVIGLCGYAKWHSKKYRLKKFWYHLIKQILMLSPNIKDKKALKQYSQNYNYTPKKLQNHFDGEISILILDKAYRGEGIGKDMILKIFEEAKKDGIKKLQILTDESCNYQFYEKIGCKKVYQKSIQNQEIEKLSNEKEEMGYIYEKTLG